MAALSTTSELQRSERVGNFSAFLHLTDEASRSRAVRSLKQLRKMAVDRVWNKTSLGHGKNVIVGFRDVASFILHKANFKKTSEGLIELMVMTEQVPNPDSRITLSSQRDRFGQPRARLDWQLTDDDYRTIEVGQRTIDEELRSAGIGRLEGKYADESPRPTLTGGWHHLGTTRMHDDPKQGVVDANCKVHGIRNLFIAGSSVFPTGGYANPTLTLVALAARLADHLQQLGA
jgi:choline dehydrogenase-like flavoprotein